MMPEEVRLIVSGWRDRNSEPALFGMVYANGIAF
jgi:hypothetical protein